MDVVDQSVKECPPLLRRLRDELVGAVCGRGDAAGGYELNLEGRAVRPVTLVYVVDLSAAAVLLGHKARGFGAGKFNGFGGKVDHSVDRTIRDAAIRELGEECGVDAGVSGGALQRCGVLYFLYPEELTRNILEVHVFHVPRGACAGVVTESEEMTPISWFSFDVIPLDKMWADDPFWLPQLASGSWARAAASGAADPAAPLPLSEGFVGIFDFESYSAVRECLVRPSTLEFTGAASDDAPI